MQWRKYTNLKRKLRKFPILTDICGDTIRCEERQSNIIDACGLHCRLECNNNVN
jgi:hypothetical protein